MQNPKSLESIAKVLRKIKMPGRAKTLQKRLKIPAKDLFMIKTSNQLHTAITKGNWRTLPIQFGLPSQSQIISELIAAAGYEAILYPSRKSIGNCLAIFPNLLADRSYVEIVGKMPDTVKHPRLDITTAAKLVGKKTLP
jgi:hypothetical protein